MSEHFSLSSWLCRLSSRSSCIDGGDKTGHYDAHAYDRQNEDYYGGFGRSGGYVSVPRVRRYYALAEDGMGNHLPYPMLPYFARCLFNARIAWGNLPDAAASLVRRVLRRVVAQPLRRGHTWHFHCPSPECNGQSEYTFRNQTCWKCGVRFDKDLLAVGRMEHIAYPASFGYDYSDEPTFDEIFADE